MKAAKAVLVVVVCLFNVVTAWTQGSLFGFFQSSLDGRTYELRSRGDLGLDIYSSDGRIMAVMDRKKLTDNYKGNTQTLATTCPNNSGKIETRSVAPDRVQLRLEQAKPAADNKPGCNFIALNKWQNFDLLKTGGPAAAIPAGSKPSGSSADPVPPQAGSGQGAVAMADLSEVHFELSSAVAEGKTLIVTVFATNRGVDRHLLVGGLYDGGLTNPQFIDDLGKTYTTTAITVGNQARQADLVNDVRTKIELRFDDLATVGGVVEANQVRRLTLKLFGLTGNAAGEVRFERVPIKK